MSYNDAFATLIRTRTGEVVICVFDLLWQNSSWKLLEIDRNVNFSNFVFLSLELYS